MPEGHTVHRTANAFAAAFLHTPVTVDSPQGRFSTDARLISGQKLIDSFAIGKQLFLRFENGSILRIHLGIYGKWTWFQGAEVRNRLAQPVIGEVRARFYSTDALAELRGPTVCEVIDAAEMQKVHDRLGPDPLNEDLDAAEYARFASRVRRSAQPIAKLLMDQSVISGIGNVYRAEILFRAGMSPWLPGNQLTDEMLRELWNDSVKLLAVGVREGVMITRDELFEAAPEKAERNFVYKREQQPCRECGADIRIEILAGRKLYWCPACQPE